MMTALRTVVLALVCVGAAGLARGETLDFEKDAPGAAPKGFAIAQTGPGAAPRWEVREDAGASSGKRVLVR